MLTMHRDLIQGSDEWLAARCGLLTASEVSKIITPSTLKPARNDASRGHVAEIAAQRITRHVEPSYIGDDMLRGIEDEHHARVAYAEHFAPVEEVGFMTEDRWGFTLGYSPDGLVGEDGAVEVKSRRQKFQVGVIARGAAEIPIEHMLQMQTGLLVTGRRWVDYVSYCGGLPMIAIRVDPDPDMQAAILAAAEVFEAGVAEIVRAYERAIGAGGRLVETVRRTHEMIL